MPNEPKSKPPELDFEEIEMLANFSDYSADYPKLSFEDIAKKLDVDFSKSQEWKSLGKRVQRGLRDF